MLHTLHLGKSSITFGTSMLDYTISIHH
jgi:hypothetical protein